MTITQESAAQPVDKLTMERFLKDQAHRWLIRYHLDAMTDPTLDAFHDVHDKLAWALAELLRGNLPAGEWDHEHETDETRAYPDGLFLVLVNGWDPDNRIVYAYDLHMDTAWRVTREAKQRFDWGKPRGGSDDYDRDCPPRVTGPIAEAVTTSAL